MKLLLDENLSRGLVRHLSASYPGLRHVEDVGLAGCTDEQIWTFARDGGYIVVSKDSDFRDLCAARGAPPKVIWLRVGNAGTAAIRQLLEENRPEVDAFDLDPDEAFLVLGVDDLD